MARRGDAPLAFALQKCIGKLHWKLYCKTALETALETALQKCIGKVHCKSALELGQRQSRVLRASQTRAASRLIRSCAFSFAFSLREEETLLVFSPSRLLAFSAARATSSALSFRPAHSTKLDSTQINCLPACQQLQSATRPAARRRAQRARPAAVVCLRPPSSSSSSNLPSSPSSSHLPSSPPLSPSRQASSGPDSCAFRGSSSGPKCGPLLLAIAQLDTRGVSLFRGPK